MKLLPGRRRVRKASAMWWFSRGAWEGVCVCVEGAEDSSRDAGEGLG